MIRRVVGLVAVFLLGGCVAVTVNVNFPQETIDSAASSIEEQVRTPAPSGAVPRSGGRRSALPGLHVASMALVVGVAHGEEVGVDARKKIRTRTPEVQALVDARRARYAALSSSMVKGCVGERADGMVERRPGAGCPAATGALLAAENRDRTELFRTIVEQNHMPAGARAGAGRFRPAQSRARAGGYVGPGRRRRVGP